jgi:hypothetical protein
MADRLVHWLRDSGEYGYSLDSSIRNPTIDPVEDFLFERKQGHCEYYASALTLMLRAVGVPSRMVSGFKGGKINRITGAYEVEQRHAHAWVEALVDDEWVTLDATPAAPRTELVEALSPDLPAMHDLLGFFRELWSSYVVNLNIHQQRERLYAPLQAAAGALWDVVSPADDRRPGLMARARDFLSSPRRWFTVSGGLVVTLVFLIFAVTAFAIRRVLRWWRLQRAAAAEGAAAAHRTVEFYERFREICARFGLVRADAQTQREFALAVPELRHGPQAGLAGELATALTEIFYRVRFGEVELSSAEAVDVERRLVLLEAALGARGPQLAQDSA